MTDIKEDAPANAVGSGAVAGLGVGPQGDPPGPQSILTRLLRRKKTQKKTKESTNMVESTFAGHDVFVVPSDYYHRCRNGKNRYHKYEKYVGKDEIGETIRQYGRDRKNKKKPIIVQDEKTGAMTYLRYGGNHKRK